MKKATIYKIAGGSAAVVTVAAPTLGVVLGTKDWTYHNPLSAASNPTEEYFDNNIASAKSTYLTEKVVNPVGGSDLSSKYIILDSAWMDYNHILKMAKKDGAGNPTDITKQIITTIGKANLLGTDYNFSQIELDRLSQGALNFVAADYTPKALESKLLSVNKLLSEYKNWLAAHNVDKKIGIYFYPVYNTRSVAIRIFELDEYSQEDQNLINGLMNKINFPDSATPANPEQQKWIDYVRSYRARYNAAQNDDERKNVDWVQLFGGEHYFETGYNLSTWYKLYPTQEDAVLDIGNRLSPMPTGTDAERAKALEAARQENIRIIGADKHEDDTSNIYKRLTTNNKFSGSDDDHAIYGLKSFYDKNIMVTQKPIIDLTSKEFKVVFTFYKFDNSSIFNDGQVQRVFNPTNIETRVKSMPLDIFGNTTATVRPTAITPADRQTFLSMMLDPKAKSFINWFHRPLTGPGLDILGTVLPSLKSPVASMLNTFKKIEAIDKRFGQEFRDDIFSDKNIDELFTLFKNNPIIDAGEFWKVCIEDFQTDIDTFWSSLSELADLDRPGIYKLYTMVTSFNVIREWLDDKIAKSDNAAKYNGVVIEDTSAIASLIFELKRQGVVPSDFNISDIIDNPKNSISIIVKGILNAPKFYLKPEYAEMILGLVAQYVSIPDSAIEKMTQPMKDFISTPGQLKNLVQLLMGDRTATDLIETIMSGNYLKIVEYVASNKNVSPALIKSIAQIAAASGLVPDSLLSLIPDTDASANMVANIFNRGGMKGVYDVVDTIISQGIGEVAPDKLSDAITKLRASIHPSGQIVDLMNIFDVQSPFELLGMAADIERIVKNIHQWGDLKQVIDLVVPKLNKTSTVKIGNTGLNTYQVFNNLKTLVDQVNLPDNTELQDVATSLMNEGANGAKLFEALIGLIIYSGSDDIDKSADQMNPLLSFVMQLGFNQINWNADMWKNTLPFALSSMVVEGHDYDMQAGKSINDIAATDPTVLDKFVNHIFEQSKALGFNIDAYRKNIVKPEEWIFDFLNPTQGDPIFKTLIQNIKQPKNTVEVVTGYITDATIQSVANELLNPFRNGLAAISKDNVKEILNVVEMVTGKDLDAETIASLIYPVIKGGFENAPISTEAWKFISEELKSLTGSETISGDLVKSLLYGFKDAQGRPNANEFRDAINKLAPGIWDTKVEQNVEIVKWLFGTTNINLNLGNLLTDLFNHQITKPYEIATGGISGVLPHIVSEKVNDISLLLNKGLIGLTSQELDKVIISLKAMISDLKGFFGWSMMGQSILQYIPESMKPLVPMISQIDSFLTENDGRLRTILTDVQTLFKEGISSTKLTADEIDKFIKAVQEIIPEIGKIAPSITSSEAVSSVQKILSLITGQGDAVHYLIHSGLVGTTDAKVKISQIVVSLIKQVAPQIPSLISDYIPKLIGGQDNIVGIRASIEDAIKALPIPSEVKPSTGVVPPTSIGSYSSLKTEANTQMNISRDGQKPILEALEALAKYKVQIASIVKYNAAVSKLNALKLKVDEIVANQAKYPVTLNSAITKASTLISHLTTSDFTFTPVDGIDFKVLSVTAEDNKTDGTKKSVALLKIEVTSATPGVIPVSYEVRIEGFKAQDKALPLDLWNELNSEIAANAGFKGKTTQTTIYNEYVSGRITLATYDALLATFKNYLHTQFPNATNEINALQTKDLIYKANAGLMSILENHKDASSFASIVVSTRDVNDRDSVGSLARIKALLAALSA